MRSNLRFRNFPLIPKPFNTVSINRQAIFSGYRVAPMAQTFCQFNPTINIREYRQSMSDEKNSEIDTRATKLRNRSCENTLHNASEFCWEVSAWHDVFGLMLNDDGLRIDKKPYDFVTEDDEGRRTVKRRIPDATMGLRSYDEYFLQRGYLCNDPSCTDNHSTKQPHKSLSEERLRRMMHDPHCGLIVDGDWGKTELIFPFAVYEAKKKMRDHEAAESQIYHACKTYLAMLDDLARDPNDINNYQTKDSKGYQMFAFTSCGAYWEVFSVYNLANDCIVETIWEGKVTDWSRSYELLCLVDQIHDFALHQHRPFVIKHLEAWHSRHESRDPSPATSKPVRVTSESPSIPSASEDEYMGVDTGSFFNSNVSDREDCSDEDEELRDLRGVMDSVQLDEDPGINRNQDTPEWSRLKIEAAEARIRKSRQTRARNLEQHRNSVESSEGMKSSVGKEERDGPGKQKLAKQKGLKKRDRGQPAKLSHN